MKLLNPHPSPVVQLHLSRTMKLVRTITTTIPPHPTTTNVSATSRHASKLKFCTDTHYTNLIELTSYHCDICPGNICPGEKNFRPKIFRPAILLDRKKFSNPTFIKTQKKIQTQYFFSSPKFFFRPKIFRTQKFF